MQSRNAYMLNSKSKNEYDWWWHSFIAVHESTKKEVPIFIEYYIVNPGLGNRNVVLEPKPSYAMIKCGCWGDNKKQFNKFFPVNSFLASREIMDVKISDCIANENELKGQITVNSVENPKLGSDFGRMSWNINILKKESYSVGYGASPMFRNVKSFAMFWHVEGMKSLYEGHVIIDGEKYLVDPITCGGYQDKNWGKDYTNPWIWLNCNRFCDKGELVDSSLDIGGGNPKLFGLNLGAKILVAFKHDGQLYEFNFSKILFQKQKWACKIDEKYIYWDIVVGNKTHELTVSFQCKKSNMLKVDYENPNGKKNHTELWNGGHAFGSVVLKTKKGVIITELEGTYGGCEFGSY